MTEAEHTVNSRPLTHVSVDLRDEEALTPNHFLIGASSGIAIPGCFEEADLKSRKQWRVAQCLADMFWGRWIREYLPTLVNHKRWHAEAPPIAVGDLVCLFDATLPRDVWPKGIVSAVYPGPDGRVRIVDIRTSKGILQCPVHKIIKLAIAEDGTDYITSVPEGRMLPTEK